MGLDGGDSKPCESSAASKAVRVAVTSGMPITRPEFKCEIVLLYTVISCCRFTTAHIQKMEGACFVIIELGIREKWLSC